MAAKKKKKAAPKKKASKKRRKKKGAKRSPPALPRKAAKLKITLKEGPKDAAGAGRVYGAHLRGPGGSIALGTIVAKNKTEAMKKARTIARKHL